MKVQRIILIAALSAAAASCTALLGLSDKTFDGAGGAGGASSSVTSSSSSSASSSSTNSSSASSSSASSTSSSSASSSSTSSSSSASSSSSSVSSSSSGGPDGGTVSVLYAGSKIPVSLVLDGTTLFWSTSNDFMVADGDVTRIETDGTNLQMLATNQTNPISLGFDGTYLYWVTTVNSLSAINKMTKMGGAVTQLSGVPVDTLLGLAVLSPTAYFTTAMGNSVDSVPTAGGALMLLAPAQKGPGGITVDATNIYWIDIGDVGMSNGTIMKADLNGMNPQTLSMGQQHPLEIEVGATKVFWATLNGGLRSVNKDGTGSFTNVSPGGAPQNDIAVDATDIYYTTQGEVRKIPIGGMVSSLVYSVGMDTAQRIVVDSQYVYFTTSSGGSSGKLLKIPKP